MWTWDRWESSRLIFISDEDVDKVLNCEVKLFLSLSELLYLKPIFFNHHL